MGYLQDLEAIVTFLIQVFVIFPYSALTIPRQRKLLKACDNSKTSDHSPSHPPQSRRARPGSSGMISDKVYKLCTSGESVSSLLAKDPSLTPGEAWKKLFGSHGGAATGSKSTGRSHRDQITPDDIERARKCGNWGPTEPSETFLRVSESLGCIGRY